MKNLFLSATLIFLIVTAQAQTTEITYDYLQDEISGLQAVKNGKFITFKIINVNTFRYKVEISGKRIDYVTPVPSELQNIFRLGNNKVYGEPEKAEEGVTEAQTGTKTMAAMHAEVKAEGTNNDLEAVLRKLVVKCMKYSDLAKEIAEIKFNRMELINISKQKWDKHSSMISAVNLINVKTRDAMKQDYMDFIAAYSEAEALYGAAVKVAEKALADARTPPGGGAAIPANVADRETDLQTIKDASEKVETSYHLISEENYLKLIEDVITLFTAMQNKEYFEAVSPPIQADGDFISFDVTISPERVNDLMPFEQAKTFNIEVPVKGGWVTDFSVGPVVSFRSGANDSLYFLAIDEPTDTTGLLAAGENKNDIRPGLAAMMHVYPRLSANFGIGFMMGVGVNFKAIDDPDISLYIGGTIILGKREKVMMSAGASFMRVGRIKSEYQTGEIYPVTLNIDDVTSKVFKPSAFFSISYNLTSKVEIK